MVASIVVGLSYIQYFHGHISSKVVTATDYKIFASVYVNSMRAG